MEQGIHCVRTHWIRGFMAFQLARRRRIVRLTLPVGPESGFRGRAVGRGHEPTGCTVLVVLM